MKRTIFLLVILAALFPGCIDDEPPPPVDPCADYTDTGLTIGVSSQSGCGSFVGNCTCDYIDTLPPGSGILLHFYPNGNPLLYDHYEWQLGTEAERRTTESFDVTFNIDTDLGPVWVTLYAYHKQDNECVSVHAGICDTITKLFVVAADTAFVADPDSAGVLLTTLFRPKGTWVGHSTEQLGEEVTVRIELLRNWYFPGSYDGYCLKGLPFGCTGVVGLNYSCFNKFYSIGVVESPNCFSGGNGMTDLLYGYCPTQDSIVIHYRKDNPSSFQFTFSGRRQ